MYEFNTCDERKICVAAVRVRPCSFVLVFVCFGGRFRLQIRSVRQATRTHNHWTRTKSPSRAPSMPTQKTRPASASLYLPPARYMGRYDLVGSPDECFSAASLAKAWSVLARRVSEAVDPRGRGCSPIVPGAASLCARGCSPMRHRWQPYVPYAAALCTASAW